MDYEPLIDVVDGRMTPDRFVADHVRPRRGTQDQIAEFMGVLAMGFQS